MGIKAGRQHLELISSAWASEEALFA